MDALLSPDTLKTIGAVGLVSLAVLLLYLGRLVPKGTHEARIADAKERLADARAESADWKAAYETSERARELQSEQLRELLEYARTTDHVIRSLQAATGRGTE